MSGVVAIVSSDADRRAYGPGALSSLRHLAEYRCEHKDADTAWLGVCGHARTVSISSAAGTSCRAKGLPAVRTDVGRPASLLLAAFCGWVLNHHKLSRELDIDGACTPAELTIAAYSQWGAGLFERLEGTFAVVLHDHSKGLTLAGTDPCCIAPLFAVRMGGDVLVSSESKAFMAVPGFRAKLDTEALADLLTFGMPLGGRPLFAGVHGLPHGAHFEIADGVLTVVRHWDVRDRPRPTLRGADYLDRLETAIVEVATEAFKEPGTVLPLTGGLDSRLLAACAPANGSVAAVTFGAPSDQDCAVAARVAAARSMRHTVLPLEPAYVARFATEAVWLLEGRLNPISNITGSLMNLLKPATAFVSGAGGAAGRHFDRSRYLVPDWNWDHASDNDYERFFPVRFENCGLPGDLMPTLVRGGAGLREAALARRLDILATTRGLPAVDREDIFVIQESERLGQTGLAIADLWIPARAPLLTRRWIEAMLAGTPDERIDDRARVRLISRLDSRLAEVPWSLTRLSLDASDLLLSALRVVGACCRRPLRESGEASGLTAAAARMAGSTMRGLQHLVYSHGDSRAAWLRGPSRQFVEVVLMSSRVAEHQVFDPDVVHGLVSRHMHGGSFAPTLGFVLLVELWQRLFEDGDDPPNVARPACGS